MTPNPVHALFAAGQSVWIDYIRRDLLRTGELARMIEDGFAPQDFSAPMPDTESTRAFAHRKETKAPEGATAA